MQLLKDVWESWNTEGDDLVRLSLLLLRPRECLLVIFITSITKETPR